MLALGFVCCGLFAYDHFVSHKEDSQRYDHPVVMAKNKQALYQKQGNDYKEIAMLEPDITLELEDADKQDMSSGYFKLKSKDIYIVSKNFEEGSSKASVAPCRYLPFQESITTKNSYTIWSQEHKPLATIQQTDTYPVYMKNEDTTGVLLDQTLYFIDHNDIDHTAIAEYPEDHAAKQIPVFMYHYFYSKANGETAKDGNWLEVKDFEEQLNYLKAQGYRSVSMQDLEYFLDGKIQLPEKSISITIDDGNKSIYQYAYPLLMKYDMQATLFLITNKFKNDTLPDTFQEMKEHGMELQSHSFAMHTGGCEGGHGGALRCVDLETGIKDTKKSFSILGGGFVYCYPYGDVTDSALEIMKDSNVRMAFTTNYGKIEPGMDKLQLPRVRIFGESGLSQFIYSLEE